MVDHTTELLKQISDCVRLNTLLYYHQAVGFLQSMQLLIRLH